MQTNKQNQFSNRSLTPHKSKKYTYSQSLPFHSSPQFMASQSHNSSQDLHQQIKRLQQQLQQQRKKAKKIEQHTISQQTKVLEQIDILENKFMQVENQKKEMKLLLEQSMREIQEYKKVKGIANAMVDMMVKVQGKNGDFHQAWRWVKMVVWEYQAIKKKGLQWKKAYDQLKKLQQKRSDTFSNDSDISSEQGSKQ